MNYAAAARASRKQPDGRPPSKPNTPQALAKQSDTIKVSANNLLRINEVERRTQVLRCVPFNTTTSSILNDLQRQITSPLKDVIEAVVQDYVDRRRFYIRYTSVANKREVSRRGFELGDITIPGEPADITGFIRNVPHYLTLEDMNGILSRYGTIVTSKFTTFEETDIRCGGFHFQIDLNENARLPPAIRILGDIMVINQKDDIKQCGYCDGIGHFTRNCRKRITHLEKRAEAELNAQLQTHADQMEEDDDDQEEHQHSTSHTFIPLQVQQANTPQVNNSTNMKDNLQQTQPCQLSDLPISHTHENSATNQLNSTPQGNDNANGRTSSRRNSFVSGGDLQMDVGGNVTPNIQISPVVTFYPDPAENNPIQSATYDEMRKEYHDRINTHRAEYQEQYGQGEISDDTMHSLESKACVAMKKKYLRTIWVQFCKHYNRTESTDGGT